MLRYGGPDASCAHRGAVGESQNPNSNGHESSFQNTDFFHFVPLTVFIKLNGTRYPPDKQITFYAALACNRFSTSVLHRANSCSRRARNSKVIDRPGAHYPPMTVPTISSFTSSNQTNLVVNFFEFRTYQTAPHALLSRYFPTTTAGDNHWENEIREYSLTSSGLHCLFQYSDEFIGHAATKTTAP
jgi:hypothetical protein